GTLTPRDLVASGFSPHERNRSPQRRRFRTYHTGNTINAATITIGAKDSNARLSPPGNDDSSGMSSLDRCGPPGSDCVDCPLKNADERKRASPTATRLMTTPEAMGSTRNVMVATACTPA